jgi:hypothetical protein
MLHDGRRLANPGGEVFMKNAVLLGLMLVTAPAQTGVIQGTVVCEGTLEPVAGVQITAAGRNVVTDSAGHFVVENAPPGRVSVRAQRRGYFGLAINGDFPNAATEPVVVNASEKANVKITLVRAGSVSGNVFDSEGRPLHDSVVGILRIVYKGGTRAVDVLSARASGKLGEYRLYPVPPGEYYVGVAPPTDTQTTTLYPGTTSLNSASRVTVKAAEEVKGIDIHAQQMKVTAPSLN